MVKMMRIGNRDFAIGKHTYVMGILNVTPDSFSDGGSFNSLERAMSHVKEMIEEGADIIDVGGESTRPNHVQITEQEEIERVVPIIREIKKQYDIPVSIDTYKANVAREALKAGADFVNDIWGLKYDVNMASVVKEYDVPVCIMHNRDNTEYGDFLNDVMEDLKESLEIAKKAGIREEQIVLDPGVGFGKTLEMNLECVNRLEEFNRFGLPVLLGTSRKSMIGLTLDLPVTEREEGTMVTTVMGVMKGCGFVRVHNVKANVRAIKMTEAILKANGNKKK